MISFMVALLPSLQVPDFRDCIPPTWIVRTRSIPVMHLLQLRIQLLHIHFSTLSTFRHYRLIFPAFLGNQYPNRVMQKVISTISTF